MNVQDTVHPGCSDGKTSTLVVELERRGVELMREPGRRIVEEKQRGVGFTPRWVRLAAFAKRVRALGRAGSASAYEMPTPPSTTARIVASGAMTQEPPENWTSRSKP